MTDRLFKLRHCLSIEGAPLELPLFEPPIDPTLLVQAAAKGLDIGAVLADSSGPLPKYRFTYMLQKALEFCADLRAFGAGLLSALEKRDAEGVAMLRAGHELEMLKRVAGVKAQQVNEATAALDVLEISANAATLRSQFYGGCIAENGVGQSGHEIEQQRQLSMAQDWQAAAQLTETLGAALAAAPMGQKLDFGSSGGYPSFFTSTGLHYVANGIQAGARVLSYVASVHSYWASQAGTEATYERRKREWQLQLDLANNERKQIDKQIEAAKLRIAIAEADLENHNRQIQAAEEVKEFLQDKFTNAELYTWMQTEAASVFFQSYRLAYDLAKQAERALRFERGLTTSNFIQFGYWDSLYSGLMSGDRLQLALKQMEKAYLDENRREYEISKEISVLRLDPLALIALKETGQCEIELPEMLFDTDYPGHYMLVSDNYLGRLTTTMLAG